MLRINDVFGKISRMMLLDNRCGSPHRIKWKRKVDSNQEPPAHFLFMVMNPHDVANRFAERLKILVLETINDAIKS